jgi:hypothetical protein
MKKVLACCKVQAKQKKFQPAARRGSGVDQRIIYPPILV